MNYVTNSKNYVTHSDRRMSFFAKFQFENKDLKEPLNQLFLKKDIEKLQY